MNGREILVRGKLVQVSSQLLEIALAVAITIKDIVSVNNDIYPAGRTTYHRGSGRIGILYREFWDVLSDSSEFRGHEKQAVSNRFSNRVIL